MFFNFIYRSFTRKKTFDLKYTKQLAFRYLKFEYTQQLKLIQSGLKHSLSQLKPCFSRWRVKIQNVCKLFSLVYTSIESQKTGGHEAGEGCYCCYAVIYACKHFKLPMGYKIKYRNKERDRK